MLLLNCFTDVKLHFILFYSVLFMVAEPGTGDVYAGLWYNCSFGTDDAVQEEETCSTSFGVGKSDTFLNIVMTAVPFLMTGLCR